MNNTLLLSCRPTGGGAKVAHGHFVVLLEEVFEVCRILVAASRRYGVHLVPRSGQQSLHLVQPPLGYGVEDAPPLEFAEPKVGEAARALQFPDDVARAYGFGIVRSDERKRALDKPAGLYNMTHLLEEA